MTTKHYGGGNDQDTVDYGVDVAMACVSRPRVMNTDKENYLSDALLLLFSVNGFLYKDAERYRWWRSKWTAGTDKAMDELNDAVSGADTDAEIDAAIDRQLSSR